MEALVAVVLPMAGGWITKFISKQKESSGHKVGAPLAAFVVAALVAYFGLDEPTVTQTASEGGRDALFAVGLHSFIKNLSQRFGWTLPI